MPVPPQTLVASLRWAASLAFPSQRVWRPCASVALQELQRLKTGVVLAVLNVDKLSMDGLAAPIKNELHSLPTIECGPFLASLAHPRTLPLRHIATLDLRPRPHTRRRPDLAEPLSMHGRRRFTLWLSFEGGELLDWARAYRCASFMRSICDRCFRRAPAQCAARTRVRSGYSGRRVEHLVQYAKLHSRDRIQVLTPAECNKVTAFRWPVPGQCHALPRASATADG